MSDTSVRIGREDKAAATAAGAGGGTLLVVVANALPESNKFKPWLLLAVPSVSVLLSGLWIWTRVRLANYLRDREADTLVVALRSELRVLIADPHTSEQHRTTLRAKLEELDHVTVSRKLDRIRLLTPVSAAHLEKLDESSTELSKAPPTSNAPTA
jgi:hypothetical protein